MAHKLRQAMAGKPPTDHGACPACGKRRYLSRKDAKAVARQLYPGNLMRFYQCGEVWHMTSQSTAEAARYREYRARAR